MVGFSFYDCATIHSSNKTMKVYKFIDAINAITEARRQKRKAKHKAKRKGKIDNRTGKRGKAK